jgi:hypothetical protein
MDDSMQIKVLSIDKAQKKAKNEHTLDFSKDEKDSWELAGKN